MTRPELRNIQAREFVRALRADGFDCRAIRGSHHYYEHRDGRILTVPFGAPGSTFAPGTLRSMLRATKWTTADLVRVGLIRDRGETPRRAA